MTEQSCVKDRLPIIIVALAGVFVIAIAVRMRSRLSTPPPSPRVSEPRPEGGGAKDLSARVDERLRMLRAEHARRLSGDDLDEPQGGGGRSERAAGGPPAQGARSAEGLGRRGAVELPVPNTDVGQTVAELKHTLTSHPSKERRIEAARDLGAMDEPDAMQALVEAMNDRDPEVRAEVLDALQEYLEDLTPDVLQPVLKDNDPDVRFEAVTLLGLMGGPDAMVAAGKLTDDPDRDVRELAEEVQQVLASDPTPLPEVTPPHWLTPPYWKHPN